MAELAPTWPARARRSCATPRARRRESRRRRDPRVRSTSAREPDPDAARRGGGRVRIGLELEANVTPRRTRVHRRALEFARDAAVRRSRRSEQCSRQNGGARGRRSRPDTALRVLHEVVDNGRFDWIVEQSWSVVDRAADAHRRVPRARDRLPTYSSPTRGAG